jgi:N-acetylmuramoyl-L-alanine amidase
VPSLRGPGVRPLRPGWCSIRTVLASITALLFAAIGVGHAAPGNNDSATAAPKASAARCDRPKFRIILDVGHTAESYGAMSARNVPEFEFNLQLAKRIEAKLKSEGFDQTTLMVTEGNARPSLIKRVAVANKRGADMLLSIHHDSVPDLYVDNWDFHGKASHFNDFFGGYSVFVSRQNPRYAASLKFAKLLGNRMAAQDLQFARQYDQWFMGKYRHPLLDIDAGVYRYDELIVLRQTRMPAVLLESGSIINRDEEVVMASEEHRTKVSTAVAEAVKEYCETRDPAPLEATKPLSRVAQPRTPLRSARKR